MNSFSNEDWKLLVSILSGCLFLLTLILAVLYYRLRSAVLFLKVVVQLKAIEGSRTWSPTQMVSYIQSRARDTILQCGWRLDDR